MRSTPVSPVGSTTRAARAWIVDGRLARCRRGTHGGQRSPCGPVLVGVVQISAFGANRLLDRGHLELGPCAHRPGGRPGRAGRARPRRARRCGEVVQQRAVSASSTTSMPIDEPPNRGLTMYGPSNGGWRRPPTSSARGSDGRPAAATTAAERELVHAQRGRRDGAGRCSGRRPDRGRLQVPSSPGPPWQQFTTAPVSSSVAAARAAPRRTRPRAPSRSSQALRSPTGRTPSRKSLRLERRVAREPVAGLRPVDGAPPSPAPASAARPAGR